MTAMTTVRLEEIRRLNAEKKWGHDGSAVRHVAELLKEVERLRSDAAQSRITTRCEPMGAHFTKHHIQGLPVPAVLHLFTAAEPEADPHDHPWGFTSFVLSGGYVEEVFYVDKYQPRSELIKRLPGTVQSVASGRVHRIVELLRSECWTLVLPGPVERVSGFYRWAEDGTPMYRQWNQEEWEKRER